MRPTFRSVSLLLVLAAGAPLVGSSSALAKEPSASELQVIKEMLKDAIADEKAGKCADAMAILKQAAAIKETPDVLFHMGECQVKMGHLRDGLTSFERSLDAARQENNKNIQQAAPPKIEQVKARIPTVTLRVPADAKGVTVRIDDEQIAADRLGAPIQLDPGEHTVNVSADGRKPFSQKLTVAEKDTPQIDVDIPLLGQPSSPAGSGSSKPEPPASSDSGGAPTIPLGTWIAGTAALALTIGGVVAFVAAGSAASDGESQCATQKSCDPSAVDSVHQLDTAALALWIGAGVGAGVAVAFYVLNKPKNKAHAPPPTSGRATETSRPSARVVVGPASFGVAGSF